MALTPNRGEPVVVQSRDAIELLCGLAKAETGGNIDISVGLPTNTETITLTTSDGAQVYTFLDALTGAANEVHIETTIDATTANLVTAINLNSVAIAVGSETDPPQSISATLVVVGGADNDTITIACRNAGASGNVAITETVAGTTVNLSGGADMSSPISVELSAAADIEIGSVNLLNIADAIIDPATEDKQDDIITAIGSLEAVTSSGLPGALMTDTTGADAYATLTNGTSPARETHNVHVAVGDNGAIISLDGGTTDMFAVPANVERFFGGLTLAASQTIQAKNLSAGNNFTNLYVSIW